ncbi:hypothetical protein PF011_g28891 [Phytophthora fragariae]|uniref:Uncharacterized protein n=1 Tax=Phytophthora fragariae TaxID=53985 RepID=A0A6A3H4Z8_9STRA|nr:hypothetical protein PF011_g28891 [Phytophthora fragariae]
MAPMATAGVLMVNIVFLVVGAMLMLFSSLESSGWADALTDTDFEPPCNASALYYAEDYAIDYATSKLPLRYTPPAQPRRSFASWAIVLAVAGIVGAIVQATWTPPR